MERQTRRTTAFLVETTDGTECVLKEDSSPLDPNFTDYLAGRPMFEPGEITTAREQMVMGEVVDTDRITERTGWFHRLSDPTSMDRTEWTGPFESQVAAEENLDEMFPPGEDDEDETVCEVPGCGEIVDAARGECPNDVDDEHAAFRHEQDVAEYHRQNDWCEPCDVCGFVKEDDDGK